MADQSRRTGAKVHVAKMFEICVVKGAELDDSDPRKIYKGRAVLDGIGGRTIGITLIVKGGPISQGRNTGILYVV